MGSPQKQNKFLFLFHFFLSGLLSFNFIASGQSTVQASTKKEPTGFLTNSIGMKMKLIQSGWFTMGADNGDDRERPLHWVKVSEPFFIGVFEVTQSEYERVTGANPSPWKNPRFPVTFVSWFEAKEFCRILGRREGREYRLPTEAEWEYACRAGTTTSYFWGDQMNDEYCWYKGNSNGWLQQVGQKKPNSWDLFDICGNAGEMCEDWLGRYSPNVQIDPKGETSGEMMAVRGGSWFHYADSCRSSSRFSHFGSKNFLTGFRVVMPVYSMKKN